MFHALEKQLKKPSGLFGVLIAKMMEKRSRAFYEKIISAMDIREDDKIFEIGYGPGDGIELLAKTYECSIQGIDYSELMYNKASARNKKYIDSGKVSLKYGDLLDSDLPNEKFDKVFCINVIYFWNNLHAAFAKVNSLLRENGEYYIYMSTPEELTQLGFRNEFVKYSAEQVKQALEQSGFGEIEFQNDSGYYIKAVKEKTNSL